MPRRGYASENGEKIVCPCFKRMAAKEREIWCESHVPECTLSVLRYRQIDAFVKQVEIYCKDNYKRCEHFLAVKHLKWEE